MKKTIALPLMFAATTLFAGTAALAPFPEFSAPRAITKGPHDHFFASYFAINSWSPDFRYALVLETDIKDKLPDGRPCTIGVVDMQDGDRFIPFSTTRTWNFQEAAMAFWLPWAKDTVVFNDMRDGKFVAVVMNWRTKEEAPLENRAPGRQRRQERGRLFRSEAVPRHLLPVRLASAVAAGWKADRLQLRA